MDFLICFDIEGVFDISVLFMSLALEKAVTLFVG